MAWNEPGGGDKDPWGGGNRGNNNNDGPPDLDEVLKKIRQKFNGVFGSGGGSGGKSGSGGGLSGSAFGIVAVVLAVIYISSGIQIINEQERGVVLRLGVYHRTLNPGFNWAPPLIDTVYPINVTRVRFHNVQDRSMLTGDLNIVEADLSVQWSISNAKDFVLNLRDPGLSLEEATDSALRHVVGSTEMHEVLTEGRSLIATQITDLLQDYLNDYGAGILIRAVNVEETTPPNEVQSAFDDVNRAREDEEREKNLAQAYANGIIPEARGRAQRVIEEANGYKQQVVSRAEGEAKRFEDLLTEYEKAPQVTRERLYLEAVQDVMAKSSKIMIDVEGGNNLLYLPLDKMVQQNQGPAPVSQVISDDVIREVSQRVSDLQRLESNSSSSRRREAR
ncbi:FtsH protease activity modulator HflK [Aurantivibrio infirmus]